ncbi:mechanosensitive ion channel family protein [Mobilicoccus caccae]|uniref:Mechanosensitive ion channel protein MscS n=1 Tax=Mobilicoccus caccae TaxID=1859295 RepID=A0ABQ6IMD8_9MICO|nr:mechanosensitive ion channel domain-containing protein [Mobilicoccus caccae]GMA39083.1 mechanosensitive ion channel protein MscS [Mobilicoccus caccae]
MPDNTRTVLTVLDGMTWEKAAEWFLGVPLAILTILLGAWIIRWLIHRAINRLVDSIVASRASGDTTTMGAVEATPTAQLPMLRRYGRKAGRAISQSGLVATERQKARVTTLGSVLRSIASIVVWSIAALMVGRELGLDMTPVIASAGVGGVALGFGAQSLVKDFLSGTFMILEDQYGVGDIVDTGDVVGTVEEVTLRVTRLRDAEGVVWYVRNGEILRIANRSQGWTTAVVDIPVASDESAEKAMTILRQQMTELFADPAWKSVILEKPDVAGIESITAGTMTIRIFAKCAPNKHWGAQREIRERCKTALHRAGVRGPIYVPGAMQQGPTPPAP